MPTFRRGASLPVATTLGHADTSDLGPSAGNGFFTRWPDDLALLAEHGLTDLRLTFDWARLQPRPGEVSSAWTERYENVFDAAEAIGLTVHAALLDDGVPRWFANEGGLDDDEAVVRWWPRWVERVADRFGDRVDVWIPFSVVPAGLPDQAWRDTWRTLGGDDAPVTLSISASDDVPRIGRVDSTFDAIGVALDTGVAADAAVGDIELDDVAERWTQALHDVADAAPDRPMIVSRFVLDHELSEVNGRLVGRLVDVLDAAIDDGLDLSTCLVEPAIAGPDSNAALFDVTRRPLPTADAYLPPRPAES